MKTSIKSIFAATLVALSFVVASANPTPTEDPKGTAAKASYAINVFKGKEGKVNLLLEKAQGKKLNVVLRNEKGAVLFSENVTKKSTGYARRFDINSLSDGNYSIEVSDGETVQKKSININTEKPERTLSVN